MNESEKNELFFRNEVWPKYNYIRRFLYTLTLDKLLAEDLTQETMFLCWQKAETIKTYSNLKSALFTIARNVFRQYKRKDPSKMEDLADPETLYWIAGHSSIEDYINYEGGIHKILFLFTDIRKEYLQVVLLADYYGFSLKEIAKLLHRNYNTIASQHARGLAEIRKNKKLREHFHIKA